MVLFYLAQACGVITLLLTVSSVQFNYKEKIIFINMLANIMCAIQYFLLSAITGAVMSIVNGIRCFVFYILKKKNIKPAIYVLIIFEIITVAGGILTWQSAWSLLPISVSMIFTYCMWQDNVQVVRIGSGVAGIGWAVYNVIVQAYVGAFQQLCQFISASLAVIKSKRANKHKKEQTSTETIEESAGETQEEVLQLDGETQEKVEEEPKKEELEKPKTKKKKEK